MSRHRRDSALHPSEGARFLFERDAVGVRGGLGEGEGEGLGEGEGGATYAAAIYTVDAMVAYRVELGEDGGVDVAAVVEGERAGEELEGKLVQIAKVIARGAKKRRADGLEPWPHRVLRWRGPGR